MLNVQDGQCGLCTHFGEEEIDKQKIVQLRTSHAAAEVLVEDCSHPKHASLHLKVTAISGCDGFEPAFAS